MECGEGDQLYFTSLETELVDLLESPDLSENTVNLQRLLHQNKHHFLRSLLKFQPPNSAEREKIQSGRVQHQNDEIEVSSAIASEIVAMSTELNLSEVSCFHYWYLSSQTNHIRFIEQKYQLPNGALTNQIPLVARYSFYLELTSLLQTVLYLFHARIHLDLTPLQYNTIVNFTNELMKENLASVLITLIQDRIPELLDYSPAPTATSSNQNTAPKSKTDEFTIATCTIKLTAIESWRRLSGDILFCCFYTTQIEIEELQQLIELIKKSSTKLKQKETYADTTKVASTTASSTNVSGEFFGSKKNDVRKEDDKDFTETSESVSMYQLLNTLMLTLAASLDSNPQVVNRHNSDVVELNELCNPYITSNSVIESIHAEFFPNTTFPARSLSTTKWEHDGVHGVAILLWSIFLAELSSSKSTNPTTSKSNHRNRTPIKDDVGGKDGSIVFSGAVYPCVKEIPQCTDLLLSCNTFSFLTNTVFKFSPTSSEGSMTYEFQASIWEDAFIGYLTHLFNLSSNSSKNHKCSLKYVMDMASYLCEYNEDFAAGFWIKQSERTSSRANKNIYMLLQDFLHVAQLASLDELNNASSSSFSNGGSVFCSFLTLLSRTAEFGQCGSFVYSLLKQNGLHTSNSSNSITSSNASINLNYKLSWDFFFHVLQQYQQVLSSSPFTEQQHQQSQQQQPNNVNNSYLGQHLPSDRYYTGGSSNSGNSSSSIANSKTKPTALKRLSPNDVLMLESILILVQSVCCSSDSGEEQQLESNMNVSHSLSFGGVFLANEEWAVLPTLFHFLMCPIPSQLKGALFNTLAMFARLPSHTDTSLSMIVLERQNWIWDHLERCCVLNYDLPSSHHHLQHSSSVTSSNTNKGIWYEMEQIESLCGSYPATCGFLNLVYDLESKNSSTCACVSSTTAELPLRYLNYIMEEIFLKLDMRTFANKEEKYQLAAACLSLCHLHAFSKECELSLFLLKNHFQSEKNRFYQQCVRLLQQLLQDSSQSIYLERCGLLILDLFHRFLANDTNWSVIWLRRCPDFLTEILSPLLNLHASRLLRSQALEICCMLGNAGRFGHLQDEYIMLLRNYPQSGKQIRQGFITAMLEGDVKLSRRGSCLKTNRRLRWYELKEDVEEKDCTFLVSEGGNARDHIFECLLNNLQNPGKYSTMLAYFVLGFNGSKGDEEDSLLEALMLLALSDSNNSGEEELAVKEKIHHVFYLLLVHPKSDTIGLSAAERLVEGFYLPYFQNNQEEDRLENHQLERLQCQEWCWKSISLILNRFYQQSKVNINTSFHEQTQLLVDVLLDEDECCSILKTLAWLPVSFSAPSQINLPSVVLKKAEENAQKSSQQLIDLELFHLSLLEMQYNGKAIIERSMNWGMSWNIFTRTVAASVGFLTAWSQVTQLCLLFHERKLNKKKIMMAILHKLIVANPGNRVAQLSERLAECLQLFVVHYYRQEPDNEAEVTIWMRKNEKEITTQLLLTGIFEAISATKNLTGNPRHVKQTRLYLYSSVVHLLHQNDSSCLSNTNNSIFVAAFELACRDSVDGHHILCMSMAFSLLDLVLSSSSSVQLQLLNLLCQQGYLPQSITLFQELFTRMCSHLAAVSQHHDGKQEEEIASWSTMFDICVSFLVNLTILPACSNFEDRKRLIPHSQGAQTLLDYGLVSFFANHQLFHQVMIHHQNKKSLFVGKNRSMENDKSTILSRKLWMGVLRLLNALATSFASKNTNNAMLIEQILLFMSLSWKLFRRVLKSDKNSIKTVNQLQELALVTSLVQQVIKYPAKCEGLLGIPRVSKLTRLMLNLTFEYASNPCPLSTLPVDSFSSSNNSTSTKDWISSSSTISSSNRYGMSIGSDSSVKKASNTIGAPWFHSVEPETEHEKESHQSRFNKRHNFSVFEWGKNILGQEIGRHTMAFLVARTMTCLDESVSQKSSTEPILNVVLSLSGNTISHLAGRNNGATVSQFIELLSSSLNIWQNYISASSEEVSSNSGNNSKEVDVVKEKNESTLLYLIEQMLTVLTMHILFYERHENGQSSQLANLSSRILKMVPPTLEKQQYIHSLTRKLREIAADTSTSPQKPLLNEHTNFQFGRD